MTLNSKPILGFDDRLFMLLGVPLVGLTVNGILFGYLIQEEVSLFFKPCYGIAVLYTLIFWIVFRYVHMVVASRFPGFTHIRQRYLVLVPTVLVVFAIVKAILNATISPLLNESGDLIPKPFAITENTASLIFIILIMSIYEGAYLFVQLKRATLEKEQLITQNISSQLEGLKSQVNPHFLFNSLNTLAAIIPEDQDRGVRFVTKLSKVYRYILEIKDVKLIALKDEIAFIKSYTFLLEERFGENISVCIDVPDKWMDKMIIPLSLQITFENAIKHNIITREQPLTIRVHIANDCLVVSNNLQRKTTTEASTRQGLQNIASRYQFFTDEEVIIRDTDKEFVVMLPILPQAA